MTRQSDQSQYFGRDLEVMHYAKNYYKWLLLEFKEFIGRNIVEVGAGSGTFSEIIFKEFQLDSFYAIEPSKNMYKLLQERLFVRKFKDRIFNGYLPDLYKKLVPRPDTFIYINVLEHVEDDDEELGVIYNSLKRNGHLCIFVPALRWLYAPFDKTLGHYRRYHKRELESKLNKNGFKVTKSKYFDSLGIIPWFIVFKMFQKKVLSLSDVNLYDKVAIPLLQRVERYIKPPIGKNLLIVAQKE